MYRTAGQGDESAAGEVEVSRNQKKKKKEKWRFYVSAVH